MDEKVLNMTGYEFENYISTLLTKIGFEVEVRVGAVVNY